VGKASGEWMEDVLVLIPGNEIYRVALRDFLQRQVGIIGQIEPSLSNLEK
jgi:hypothetical protein